MCKVITFSNQKGGVGKTTTTINFSMGLARRGYRVLIIDADPQGNTTQGLGYNPEELSETIFNILMDIKDNRWLPEHYNYAILTHKEKGCSVDLCPANLDLSTYESHIIGMPFGRERQLKKYTDVMKNYYDYIIIDSSPSLNLLNINVFTAADEVIIPIQAQVFSTRGLANLINFIQELKDNGINSKLKINGILFTIVNPKTVSYRDVVKIVTKELGSFVKIYDSYIHDSVTAKDAPSHCVSLYEYKKDARVTLDYELFIDEYLSDERGV